MRDANDTWKATALEMRWRALSLAADMDRLERAPGGEALLKTEPNIEKLRRALKVILEGSANRAEQVQMIFSDVTPPPQRNTKR
jgi:hypothetical protein